MLTTVEGIENKTLLERHSLVENELFTYLR